MIHLSKDLLNYFDFVGLEQDLEFYPFLGNYDQFDRVLLILKFRKKRLCRDFNLTRYVKTREASLKRARIKGKFV